MKNSFLATIALLAIAKLVDFTCYGRQPNDLYGALGLILVLGANFTMRGSSAMRSPCGETRVVPKLLLAMGTTLVYVHFLVKWETLPM